MNKTGTMMLALALATASPAAAQMTVHDPLMFLRQLEQLKELKAQVEALHRQLDEAKRLYDAVNRVTDINDAASLLGDNQFRRTLPPEIAQIEGLIAGQRASGALTGLVEDYLGRNRFDTGVGGPEDFYVRELDRVARATGAKHGLGQQVYDTAARRIEELEKLRQRIGTASSAAEKMDLGNRLQAETALLQNEVLRMQGLAMVQQARTEMDLQRERERRQKTADEMKAAVR